MAQKNWSAVTFLVKEPRRLAGEWSWQKSRRSHLYLELAQTVGWVVLGQLCLLLWFDLKGPLDAESERPQIPYEPSDVLRPQRSLCRSRLNGADCIGQNLSASRSRDGMLL